MEQYKTNNKIFNSFLETCWLKLQKENFNSNPEDFSFIFNKYAVKNAGPNVQMFMKTYTEIKKSKKPTQIEWRTFLMHYHQAFLSMDKDKINKIKNALLECQNQLENLENTTNTEYILQWFKDFCKNISTCLSAVYGRIREATSENISNQLILYIVQLTTCTKLIYILFSDEMSNKMLITESRRFLKKRFIYIFDGIKKILDDNDCPEHTPGFIQWIDNSLDLISELDPNKIDPQTTENIKISIEEVLCHAMSIAQICSEDDCKKIKASVQTVLHEFKQLETEHNKSIVSPSFVNLYIDLVSDKLCNLERRVNTAVLNISLKVFSHPFAPLKKLQNFCEESEVSILCRSEDDLDELIQNFDAHVDCMIQVGLFAIACSTNVKIIAKIRSYLASLESLECELIPALTSLYMEPSKSSCLYANLFVKHWCEEVKQLRSDVCFIIDPVAFGQVIYDEFKINLENMQLLMSNPKEVLKQELIIPLCKNVEVLLLVVDASIKEMKISQDSAVYKHVKNLKDVHREVLAASKILTDDDRKITDRVFKRVLILSSMIERIIKAFSDENNCTKISQSKTESKVDLTKIIDNISLKNLQNRGLEILKDRSVLYKTPNKPNTKVLSVMTPRNFTSTKKPENRKLGISFVRKTVLPSCNFDDENETMDLQITEILEEITNLADTLKL